MIDQFVLKILIVAGEVASSLIGGYYELVTTTAATEKWMIEPGTKAEVFV